MRKFFCLGLAIIFLTGCTSGIYRDNSSIKRELEEMGYRVISYEGRVEEYEITKDRLARMPYMVHWGLQDIDYNDYLDQRVYVEKFIVRNHPLDNWESKGNKDKNIRSKGKTEIYAFIINGKIVGGISYPHLDNLILGGFWNLEGKKLEDIYMINDLEKWKEDWIKNL